MVIKLITVVGGTGNQGFSVISTLLGNPSYRLRTLTRNPASEAAKQLAAQGVEVVQADLDDVGSLKVAFDGSFAVYAMTNFFETFEKTGAEQAMEVEERHGVNMGKAALETPTLQHYIWSTLPNALKISDGETLIPHFHSKNKVDAFIRSQPALLAKTTFFWISWYHSNYMYPPFTPHLIDGADCYVQLGPYPPDAAVTTIGDVRSNVGPFVEAILAAPAKTRRGAIVLAEIEDTTMSHLLTLWGRANNRHVASAYVDMDTFSQLWGKWGQELGPMMMFWNKYRHGRKSWSEQGQPILTRKDLGVQLDKLVSLEDAYRNLTLC